MRLKTMNHKVLLWNSVSSSNENQGKYRKLKNGVLNSFDHFENYIYESSNFYVTSSVGEFYDLSFPKNLQKLVIDMFQCHIKF